MTDTESLLSDEELAALRAAEGTLRALCDNAVRQTDGDFASIRWSIVDRANDVLTQIESVRRG